MAGVATIGVAGLDGFGRGDEIKGMVASLGLDRVFARLGHVTLDALTADAERGVVSMFVERLVLRANILARSMTGKA